MTGFSCRACRQRHERQHRHGDAGFSLLEAIVAMVLISVAGLALFSWINTSFISLNRIQESNARAAAETNALQFLQTINPMQRPSGITTLGRLKLEWRSKAITEPQANLTDTGANGPFTVALYEVEATIEELPEVAQHRFAVRLMGYERLPFDADPFGESTKPTPAKKTAPAANAALPR